MTIHAATVAYIVSELGVTDNSVNSFSIEFSSDLALLFSSFTYIFCYKFGNYQFFLFKLLKSFFTYIFEEKKKPNTMLVHLFEK